MTSAPGTPVTEGGNRRAPGTGPATDTGTAPPAGSPVRKLLGAVWLWPALVAAALTLYNLGGPVMWHDELATISVVNRSTGQILATLHNVDAVHGAYYLSLHFWVSLVGDSPFAIRFPSAMAMVAATVCTAVVGKKLFGDRSGIAAGLVFALLPTVARYGQETRSYALVVMSSALALLLLVRALERPGPLRWVVYTLSVGLVGYFNLVALTFLAGHALLVLVRFRETRARRLLVGFTASAVGAVVLVYPVLHLGGEQSKRQIGWVPKPTVHGLATIWPQIFGSLLLVLLLLLLALPALLRKPRGEVLAVVGMVFIPWLLVWGVSHGSSSYYLSKYLFFLLPPSALLVGAGLGSLRTRYLVPLTLAVAAVAAPAQRDMHAPLSHAEYTYPDPLWFTPLDYRAAAGIVAAGYRPGDGMVYGQKYSVWWEESVGIPYYLPSDVQPPTLFVGETATRRNDLWFTFCKDPAACLGDHPRLWLVAVGDVKDAFSSVPANQSAVLRPHYTVQERRTVSGITVFLLVRKA
ncbi:glycosyltransferase family 39 protein [Streptacidiphilus sp. N1-12]|uniref:Glycosyltransferase family 39 protein n=2 Tax=Streptacidiphilus alkalitolerans TaxID=3342712 RepID=A0ABV6X429_9ACTN